MPYSVPFQWEHGDYPTAARMNLYKDGLDAIYATLGTYKVNYAVARRIAPVQGYFFVHHHRWLIYRGNGRIEDPLEIGEDVSLSPPDTTNWYSYDLRQVDWLFEGKIYQVQAVEGCFEDVEPI